MASAAAALLALFAAIAVPAPGGGAAQAAAAPNAAPKPGAASGAIRVLFVGVDKYLYSRARLETGDFNDLHGAVNDVAQIKHALRTAYRLDLDRPSAGCSSSNPVSITLTDQCATRAAILAGFADRLALSKPGDTLIFFFAGHGSQAVDDENLDQASGLSDTILPTDARDPDAEERIELLDSELRGLIDGATAQGVNVVSMFDSCHSGTGVRGGFGEGADRFAPGVFMPKKPAARATPRAPARTRPAAGPSLGYRVHLAAATDDQKAREVPLGDGSWAGVFTTALAQTLVAMPDASFGDIATEVRRKVEEQGHSDQIPQAEGELRAKMGRGARYAIVLAARPAAGKVVLDGTGRLSGMTVGSRFDLFGSSTDALDGTASLASATVAAVEAGYSTLTLDRPPAKPLPARLYARETHHAFGAPIRLRAEYFPPAAAAILARIVAADPMLEIAEPPQFVITAPPYADGTEVYMYSASGIGLADLGDSTEPGFAARLRDTLGKIAQVQALVGLRTDPAKAATSLCVSSDLEHDLKSCPPAGPMGHVLSHGRPAKLSVVNIGAAPRYVYVLGIDERMGIRLLMPRNGGIDPPLPAGRAVQREIEPQSFGRYRFVTIATDGPIDAAALQQQPVDAGPGEGCRSGLERGSCMAAVGAGDATAPRVGAWSATVTDVEVQ